MKHILIPIDFSEHSLTAARLGVSLAEAHGAMVTLLHAVDLWSPISIDPKVWEAQRDEQLAGNQRELELVREQLNADHAGVDINVAIRSDEPSHAILTTAVETQADLISMASYGADAGGRFLLGSVAARVARRAPCPVLVTRKDQEASFPADARFAHPIVAVDYSKFSLPAARQAAALAKDNATVELIHIFRGPANADGDEIKQAIADARAAELERLESFAQDIDVATIQVDYRAEVGLVASQILDYIAASNTDLLVVGAHGRPETVPHLGTVADRVLRGSPVPVVLLPEGYAAKVEES